ncbi:hypothetical protein LDENG_00113120 [Lucifuga dentata]|nr:hypothetical protein LDENG_00113120 [Lucifuga dentata]
MATNKEPSTEWKTTIIVSTSLQNDTKKMLLKQQHRIRFSDNVEPGVFIFPLSGTAFLLVDPQDFPEHYEESELFAKIKNFIKVHRNSFLLLQAPFNGQKDLEILSAIQHRFFDSNLKVLPVRNNIEIVKGMLMIAKVKTKEVHKYYLVNLCNLDRLSYIYDILK